jgi:hypothetical protein
LNKRNGQSLLELAIFGSLLIMLLGVLVSYGLRYNLQIRRIQRTFRTALHCATLSVIYRDVSLQAVKDMPIPSPSDTWGVGQVEPFSASAGVKRNFQMDLSAEDRSEISEVHIQVGDTLKTYKAAALRGEWITDRWSPEDTYDKYEFIYGPSNVLIWQNNVDPHSNPGPQFRCYDNQCVLHGDPINYTVSNSICINQLPNGDSRGVSFNCVQPRSGDPTPLHATIEILDSNAGEIIDYNQAVKTCKMLVNQTFCQKECINSQSPGYSGGAYGMVNDTDWIAEACWRTCCAGKTNPPNEEDNSYSDMYGGAWYCKDWQPDYQNSTADNPKFFFPVLSDMMLSTKSAKDNKAMGLQPDMVSTANRDDQLHSWDGVVTPTFRTIENLNWTTSNRRKIIYNNVLYPDAGGYAYREWTNPQERDLHDKLGLLDEVETPTRGQEEKQWWTPY